MLSNPVMRLLENLAIGLLVGLAAAALASGALSSGLSHGFAIALVFVAAELASLLVGSAVGLAALATGSLCVSFFLFEPIGRLYVSSPADRAGLIWLVAGGTPLCLLLAWTSSLAARRRTRTQGN